MIECTKDTSPQIRCDCAAPAGFPERCSRDGWELRIAEQTARLCGFHLGLLCRIVIREANP